MEERRPTEENRAVKITHWYTGEIRLTHTVSRYRKPETFSASDETDLVRLHFGLRGDYRFVHRQLNRSFALVGGHHNAMYSKGFDITVENKTPEIETFGIQFPKGDFVRYTQDADDGFNRFAAAIQRGKSALLSERWGTIDTATAGVIDQVLRCPYSGELQRLFLHSKSIELLVLAAESYRSANGKRESVIKGEGDRERIVAARDFINGRLASPPTLTEIAKAIGTNEYKLKRGFKEVFGCTVFDYLTDRRLQWAHRSLLETHKTAAEIAYETGYSSPQHFSQAFKNKFGYPPNSVRKNP